MKLFQFCALLFLSGIYVGTPYAVLAMTATSSQPVIQESYERAIVEKYELTTQTINNQVTQIDRYHIRFLSGPFDYQVKIISGEIDSNPYGLRLVPGDKVVVFVQADANGQTNFFIEGFDRRGAIIWLVILFVAMLVVLAGWQGIKVAASIGISLLLIGFVLIPSFLKGINPVPVAIVLTGIFTLLSTGFATGWNRRTLVTVVGTMGGTIVAYFVAHVFASWAHLNGLSSEEDRLFFHQNPTLNPSGLLFAGIIIASAGIVEDVAVSIVSAVSEVSRAKPNASFRELFSSGMTVGRDHMSALANTLVFAYVGSSLSSLLLYQQFKSSWLKFINFDTVVDEIVRSLAGTIGLIFTVPITALLAAWVMHRYGAGQESRTHAPHFYHH